METGKRFTTRWRQSQESAERQTVDVSEERPGPYHGASRKGGSWSRSDGFPTDRIRPWAHGLF